MDSENNFFALLEEACTYNKETFFKDSEWSSLGGLSQISFTKDILLLNEEENTEDLDEQGKQNQMFSQKIQSRIDE